MADCIVLTVESSEDEQSPSATVCLFKQVSWLSLWQADEQKRPIFLQGHAFRPLSLKHINLLALHLHTVVLSTKGLSDACKSSL